MLSNALQFAKPKDQMISLQRAKFLKSTANAKQYPDNIDSEVAFAGRSNAGKSSAINALCQQKSLARHSKTPGRTQLINFFSLTAQTCLVDLPGYGFAKAPGNVRKKWHHMIQEYFELRQPLRGVILLMDIRHPLSSLDMDFVEKAMGAQIPLLVLLSKADKISRNAQQQARFKVAAQLKQFEPLVRVEVFSAHKNIGLELVTEQISAWLAAED